MKQVKITANSNASLRTKNRIRDNGPVFMLEKIVMNVLNFENETLFLKSKTTNWCGWIPLSELEIEESNETN